MALALYVGLPVKLTVGESLRLKDKDTVGEPLKQELGV